MSDHKASDFSQGLFTNDSMDTAVEQESSQEPVARGKGRNSHGHPKPSTSNGGGSLQGNCVPTRWTIVEKSFNPDRIVPSAGM